jgi:hypothetical protein
VEAFLCRKFHRIKPQRGDLFVEFDIRFRLGEPRRGDLFISRITIITGRSSGAPIDLAFFCYKQVASLRLNIEGHNVIRPSTAILKTNNSHAILSAQLQRKSPLRTRGNSTRACGIRHSHRKHLHQQIRVHLPVRV